MCEQPAGSAGTGPCRQALRVAGFAGRGLEREPANSHPKRYHWPIASESDVETHRPHAAETNKKGSP